MPLFSAISTFALPCKLIMQSIEAFLLIEGQARDFPVFPQSVHRAVEMAPIIHFRAFAKKT
jgi:hypothetical protein